MQDRSFSHQSMSGLDDLSVQDHATLFVPMGMGRFIWHQEHLLTDYLGHHDYAKKVHTHTHTRTHTHTPSLSGMYVNNTCKMCFKCHTHANIHTYTHTHTSLKSVQITHAKFA